MLTMRCVCAGVEDIDVLAMGCAFVLVRRV